MRIYEDDLEKGSIINGVLYDDGVYYYEDVAFNGFAVDYIDDRISSEVPYVNGVLEGEMRNWDEEGFLNFKGAYHAGRPVGTHLYFNRLILTRRIIYNEYSLKKSWEEWDQKGRTIKEIHYTSYQGAIPDYSFEKFWNYEDRAYVEKIYIRNFLLEEKIWREGRIEYKDYLLTAENNHKKKLSSILKKNENPYQLSDKISLLF